MVSSFLDISKQYVEFSSFYLIFTICLSGTHSKNGFFSILVPEYGVMHLELIPMLVGFFTYKIATFTQAIEEALTIVGKKSEV